MMLYRNSLFILCLFFASGVFAESSGPHPLSLLNALKQGGHLIYMRHGKTNHEQKDLNRSNLEDCSTQRNLSESGRAELQTISAVLTQFEIPVAQVLSSPYCRCRDTAAIVFGNIVGNYRIADDLQFSISKDQAESQKLGARLLEMMHTADTSVGNAVFVGHTSNLRDALGVWPKPEGVMVLFKKQEDRLELVGMITPEQWPALLQR